MEKRSVYDGNAHRQIFTALIATVPTFVYGIQIGWLSPMRKILKSEDGPAHPPLTDSDISWMAAALPLSAILGLPFFIFTSDRFGRKISIMFVSLLSCVSWAIKLYATQWYTFVIARVFAGLAAGGCFVTVPVYVKEISQDSWRGTLGSLVMTVCKLGVIGVYALGMSASYYTNQSVYLAISGCHVVAFAFMPESPNFLVKIGKEKQATKTVAWLRNREQYDQAVTEELVKLKDEQRVADQMPKITVRSFVQDRATFSALRMTLVLMGIQTLSGCFAVMNYAADVFARAGTEWSPDTLALLVGSLQLAGSFLTTVFIDRFGRKIPLAASSLTVSTCMGLLATYFLSMTSPSQDGGDIPTWLPVVAVCLCIFAYGAGLAPVPFVVMAEVFSFELRSRMAGLSMAFSFLCSSGTVLFYTPVANALGAHVVFFTFAAVGLFGAVYTALCVPETKGKSLSEIQMYWNRERRVDA